MQLMRAMNPKTTLGAQTRTSEQQVQLTVNAEVSQYHGGVAEEKETEGIQRISRGCNNSSRSRSCWLDECSRHFRVLLRVCRSRPD